MSPRYAVPTEPRAARVPEPTVDAEGRLSHCANCGSTRVFYDVGDGWTCCDCFLSDGSDT